MKPAKAMLLAAGRGERLRPITDNLPKPLVEVAGRSLIDRQLDLLEAFGIDEVIVNSFYLAPLLEAHLAKRSAPAIRISREPVPLETGGGVTYALEQLGGAPFFVMNSDVILLNGATPALERLASHWDDRSMDALLLLHPREKATGYAGAGDFFFDGKNVDRRGTAAAAPYVFTGTQILSPRLFDRAPQGKFSLNILYDRYRSGDRLGRIAALVHDGDWLHIGDCEELARGENFMQRRLSSRRSYPSPHS